jgi:hypothetical protein
MVVHASNPRFLGDGDQKDHGLRTAQAKTLARIHLNKQSGYGDTSMIPVMWEAQVGGLWSEASPRQKYETLPEKTAKFRKELGTWLK